MSNGIIFAMVAGVDGSTVAEYSRVKGNHSMNAKKVLQSIPKTSDRRCIAHNSSFYNIVGDGSFLYLCVTEESFSRVTAFNFLTAIKNNCGGGRAKSPQEMHQQLKKDVDFFSDPKNDKITKIRDDIAQVKEIMIDNIEKILERGDKIDTLVSKTEDLQTESKKFESGARELKWKMFKKRMILTAIVIFVIALVIFIIVLIACSKDGVNFNKCKSSDSGSEAPAPAPPIPPVTTVATTTIATTIATTLETTIETTVAPTTAPQTTEAPTTPAETTVEPLTTLLTTITGVAMKLLSA